MAEHQDHHAKHQGTQQEQGQQKHQHGDMTMVDMMRKNHEAHLAPAPGFEPPMPNTFPAPVIWAPIAGATVGIIIGWIVGILLLDGTIVVSGWEQLYSMTPGTFKTFWAGMGGSLGVLIAGVASIVLTPAPAHDEQAAGDQHHS